MKLKHFFFFDFSYFLKAFLKLKPSSQQDVPVDVLEIKSKIICRREITCKMLCYCCQEIDTVSWLYTKGICVCTSKQSLCVPRNICCAVTSAACVVSLMKFFSEYFTHLCLCIFVNLSTAIDWVDYEVLLNKPKRLLGSVQRLLIGAQTILLIESSVLMQKVINAIFLKQPEVLRDLPQGLVNPLFWLEYGFSATLHLCSWHYHL